MEKYIIKGGKKLTGKINAECAKNSVLPIIAASILTKDEVVIKDCPKILDVINMIKIIKSIGVNAFFQENNLIIQADNISGNSIGFGLCKELRTSVLMIGTLLSRCKRGRLFCPGGCDIGLRPINLHIDSLKKLGAEFVLNDNEIMFSCKKIEGRDIFLSFPSVGATENIILSSVFCKGKTVIKNCAREPEIVDLINFINSMGGNIVGGGTNSVTVYGVKSLHGTEYRPMPDRIEIGTYLIATAITGGEIEISNASVKNIYSFLSKFCNNTCKIDCNDDIIHYKSGVKCKSFDISTGPYPLFPTDLQAQMTTLACVADGVSTIKENLFEDRFKHLYELKKMGANIFLQDNTATVFGGKSLHGERVYAHDLRGGAALVLAGLVAEGETLVENSEIIKRGYLDLDIKLLSLGAEIELV